MQWVIGGHDHISIRKIFERLGPHRAEVGIFQVIGIAHIVVPIPQQSVLRAVIPTADCLDGLPSRHDEIRIGIDEDLLLDGDTVSVPGQLTHDRRKIAAGTVAAHRDPVSIHADLLGVVVHPLEPGICIFDTCREFVFRRKSIVHRGKHAATGCTHHMDSLIMCLHSIDCPTATMIKNDDREQPCISSVFGIIQFNPQSSPGTGNELILGPSNLHQRRICAVLLDICFPHSFHCVQKQRLSFFGADFVHQFLGLFIDAHTQHHFHFFCIGIVLTCFKL